MSERKEFSLMNNEVRGEFWINEDNRNAIILVHGFGVARDARGMFTELGSLLEGGHNVVMFDFSSVDKEGNTTTSSFSDQAEKLERVIKHTREELNPEVLNIIAHSQGCIVVGLISPENIDKIILVSGPTSAPGDTMKRYFSKREGTEINEQGVSKLKRSDGKLTFIPSDYWGEATEVNPTELFLELVKKSTVYFVRAKQDQVVTGEDYSRIKNSDIIFIELDGNHDFEGTDRKPWLTKMVELLEE
jgi:pimeloyl-ACP methyl ester carboxylesterase